MKPQRNMVGVSEAGLCGIMDLPEALVEGVLLQLTLSELSICCCVNKLFLSWAQARLRKLDRIDYDDFSFLPRLFNFLLLGDGGQPSLQQRAQDYLPAAFHYISKYCRSIQSFQLDLPAPPTPLSSAAARAAAAEAFLSPAFVQDFPPVDGFLAKLVAQGCPQLHSLRFVNVTNNRAMNRLVHINDAFLGVLANSCPHLRQLHLGHTGGEGCVYNLGVNYFCDGISDLGIKAIAKSCRGLWSLGLLRCNKVTDEGLGLVSTYCRRLQELKLHDCLEISDAALVELAESCTQLRRLDVTVARRAPGLLLLAGEEGEQLGFRALFTLGANCPLLEELVISESSLDSPAVDDDSMICIAQGCRRLRRLELRHCSGVSDVGARALANRCKELKELVLEHTGVGDAGVLAITKGCPLLTVLHVTNYSASLGRLHPSSAPTEGLQVGTGMGSRGITDASLRHIADWCANLEDLAVTGSRLVTDSGVRYLALPKHAALHLRLRHLAINHTGATERSVCHLLKQCTELRSLGIRGLLFNADNTMECIARSCRSLKSINLRHCSTLSDAGLAFLAGIPFLEDIYASFCGRLTDRGITQLAAKRGRRLRRLELYHVPQLTEAAVAALMEECKGGLRQVNLGKCEAIKGCVGKGGVLVQACHYLDY